MKTDIKPVMNNDMTNNITGKHNKPSKLQPPEIPDFDCYIYEDEIILRKYTGSDRIVTVPDCVAGIGYMAFCDCSHITSITIPRSVRRIGAQAFQGCINLERVTMADSVISIGPGSFCGCASLASVHIPNSVQRVGKRAFSGCNITVHAPNPPEYYGYELDEGVTWVVQ